MDPESVHNSSPAFTTDTAGLRFRPLRTAGVHYRSRRMVTSLVTSHRGTARIAGATQAGSRLPSGLIGTCVQAAHRPSPGQRASSLSRAGEPARPDPGAGEPGLHANRERRLVTRQCTPAPAYRTASAHPGTGLNPGAPSAPARRLLSGAATSRLRTRTIPRPCTAPRPADAGKASR